MLTSQWQCMTQTSPSLTPAHLFLVSLLFPSRESRQRPTPGPLRDQEDDLCQSSWDGGEHRDLDWASEDGGHWLCVTFNK